MYRFYETKDLEEKTIQENMGHADVKTTRKYDRRMHKNMTEEMVNKVFGFEIPRTNMEKDDDSLLAITRENK